jgi:hypothetical protein
MVLFNFSVKYSLQCASYTPRRKVVGGVLAALTLASGWELNTKQAIVSH